MLLTGKQKCLLLFIMEITSTLNSLESEANALGIPLEKICKEASIARSTFQRWKSGSHSPQLSKFNQLTYAFDILKSRLHKKSHSIKGTTNTKRNSNTSHVGRIKPSSRGIS